ncbi:sigma-54-dependent transcriptional regulator [Pseudobdellovibrio sp. HCB154]|uniref:sigma-54-dependent transcriptional regulator n=1 Tax=Pseudobdellovibrio sp. HCB154 TaxID=3386277 RepID=UPI00391726BB
MSLKQKIAVVDDDLEMGRVVKDLLTEEGYEVAQYSSAAEALAKIKTDVPHVLITDHKMKDIDGLMLLKKIQLDYPDVITLMMTGFGSIETAIEAMKLGAYHYITKPFKNEELILLVKRAIEKSTLKNENKILKLELNKSFSVESITGKSPAMASVFELIKLVAGAPANVLITGESGSGKEVIARAIHNSGERKKKPFIPINCTAIPENLLESELFGHVKGSFTGATNDKKGLFEEANNGTLFLDEIGDLSLPLQAKLLRVIQDKQIRPVGGNQIKQVDVRIIAATHRDLKIMVKDGKFREDLFYRLNVIPVRVPALRERIEDIPLLVERFIQKFASYGHSKVKSISAEALQVLMAHSWPGNVRELENVVERAMVLSRSETIEKSAVLDSALAEAKQSVEQLYADRPTLEKLEERYIKMVMSEVNQKKDEAAKVLGVSRRTLYRKERLYGLISADAQEPDDELTEKI